MKDRDCVEFLQWALPRLALRWPGFRKVRGQVCKRVQRRMNALGLASVADYRARLEENPDEWTVLDGLCRVTISRFYRDRAFFAALRKVVLPELAARDDLPELHCWCAGCAGGEEPYTLAVMWDLELAARFPHRDLRILATDADPVQLDRARRAAYPPGALRELPAAWRERAFALDQGLYTLRPEHRERVAFALHDLRDAPPEGSHHLVLCRNLAFTYFDEGLQARVLDRLRSSLAPGGFLAVGERERLPGAPEGLIAVGPRPGLYRAVLPLTKPKES